ncbi:FemAB family XrtA/PEP-CTERM system-associated protein [Pelotalea chapellei]|uniref:FemAB family PEP-CTERM system-associated protein n=1 Tax=Pelotalea chapellei TaxID=44671 RepID=A0ABS5U5B2_9BACT|nr:FemAB family XrtA/PEP-CTERM system-associated protein [Pelotalea chapellei]MBT1070839.1 FemAB family PEP-CTERM system-associated protein [Pelotalea chapellei]
MKIRVQGYDKDGSAWDSFVTSQKASSNYHLYGWREVIEKSFGHKTYYLAAMKGDNEICGILPLVHMKSRLFGNFMISLPFFNYGGMLSDNEDATGLLVAESRLLMAGQHADFAEFRHTECSMDAETKQHKVSMVLDLHETADNQWKALDSKVRNQVRKAEKSGLTTEIGGSELLDQFYEVFCRNMRDLGTPVYGRNFFQTILETFRDTTRIIIVKCDGITIAAGLMTWYRDVLEVPWASSISDYKNKCPNNLLYWEAIKFAIAQGAQRFDFGRSTPGEGTFCFKKQWGAKPVPLYWQYLLKDGQQLPELNPSNPKYRMAVKLWQQLPVPVTKILGPAIVKNIP